MDMQSNADAVLQGIKIALAHAAEEIGMAAESHAKLYITAGVYESPEGWYIRTGNLRNSITHETESGGDYVQTVAVGTNVEYAPYVELGTGRYAQEGGRQTPWRYQDSNGNWHTTSGMPPRPYLRPAIENHKQEYLGIIKDNLNA